MTFKPHRRLAWYWSPTNWMLGLSVIWFLLVFSLLAAAIFRQGVSIPWLLALYALLTLVLSVVAFLLYGWDKRSAQSNRRRVPESTLHLMSLGGGWPGAFLGQCCFRHKTQKLSFLAVFWVTVALHFCLIGYGLIYGGWPSIAWTAWWGPGTPAVAT